MTAKLVYSFQPSLDGYAEDREGSFAWAEPDPELHQVANDEAADAAAFLFGRGLYDVMEDHWTDVARHPEGHHEVEVGFAQAYVATPRFVFSDTITSVPDGVTLVRSADADATVERLKRELDGELHLGGPGLAASLAHLLDVVRVRLVPVIVGGGKALLPTTTPLHLRLVQHKAYASGWVQLDYDVVR